MIEVALPLLLTLLAFVGPDAASAATGSEIRYRGLEDQNQPVRLVYDKPADRLAVRIGYIAHCVGTDGENEGDAHFAEPLVARSPKNERLRVASDGTFAERFRARVDRSNNRDGIGPDELHRRFRIAIAGRVGTGGRASGTIRVRYTEKVIDREEGVRFLFESRCDSDVRRWRTPRFKFTGQWRPTGPIPVAVPKVLLPLESGNLLALGAKTEDDFTPPRAATYSPARNRWRRTPPPDLRHNEPAAALLLRNGRVLVAGGWSDTVRDESIDRRTLRAAELYNPRTRRWTNAGRLTLRRVAANAELLPDGRVLIVGGGQSRHDAHPTPSAEIFDPETERFTATAPMPHAFFALNSAVLPSGGVLCIGQADDGAARAVVFDPASETWSALEVPPELEYVDSVVELEDGRILAMATEFSDDGSRTPVAAIFTEGAGWASISPPPARAMAARSVLLPSGRVLVAMEELTPGDFASQRAGTYDPATDTWEFAEPYFHPYSQYPHFAPTPDGALFVTDGPTRYTRTERFFDE